jgi:hypothetical protein
MVIECIGNMLIHCQVTVFQWLLYIKYGGPTRTLARRVTATLLRHSTTNRLPTPLLYYQWWWKGMILNLKCFSKLKTYQMTQPQLQELRN